MKDDYKRLSTEWGNKARKEEGRQRKSRLKADTRKRVAEAKADDLAEQHAIQRLPEAGPKRAVKGTIEQAILVRMPEAMHRAVTKAAKKDNVSASEWIRAAIERRLTGADTGA